ncbi:hypothetical protein F5051DRAFT_447225 [Lentinula edodes]|nr:hypothetical protein F5051DRAFT_447225 [Lentinula edodes]
MPFELPHSIWKAVLHGTTEKASHTLLIDDGCPFVLIRSDIVSDLGLKQRSLHRPQAMSVAMSEGSPQVFDATHYCKLSLDDPSGGWSSCSVRALIVPSLCYPMILGIPFLAHNFLMTDYAAHTVIDKTSGFDLMNPSIPFPPPAPSTPKQRCAAILATYEESLELKKSVILELRAYFHDHPRLRRSDPVSPIDVVAAIRSQIEHLSLVECLQKRGEDIKNQYADVFGDIPHIDELPSDITCKILLKDADMTMQSHGYASPRKYREAWSVLIEKHLQAGQIHPSSSQYSLPAFLVPKADPTALPR